MKFIPLLLVNSLINKLSLRIISLLFISLFGCNSKLRDDKITFGLNSCFELNKKETVITPDTFFDKFFKDNCRINGVSLAMNRVIRSSESEYIFISIVNDLSLQSIPSKLKADTTLHLLATSEGKLGIANISEYYTAIASRNEYWLYYFTYYNDKIKRPFVIVFCSKSKEYIDSYYFSTKQIKMRLDCENDQ